VQAQGGDPAVGEGGRGLPQAPLTVPVFPPGNGWLAEVRARPVAEACLLVGAGRETKGSTIDPAVGLVFEAELGDKVDADRPVARLHVRSEEQAANARRVLQEAFILQDMAPTPRTIILGEL
jgi:thymidine phosphorylase